MKLRHVAVLVLVLLCGNPVSHAAESDLKRQQAAAQRDRDSLRERIRKLDADISGSESSRRDVTVALKESESAISELDRRLETLAEQSRHAAKDLESVRARISKQTDVLAQRQAQLADQLRAQYAGGLSPWAALLSGEDPQDIARDLGYLEYVSRAQAKSVRAVRETLDELASLREQAQRHEKDIQQLAAETTEKRKELEAQRAERLAILQRIESELKAQRGEAERLAQNEQRLGKLVDALAVAIEEEAAATRRRAEEARRLAEERRRAEERRLAEEKRLAEERRAEAVRKAEAERRAEEERRLAAARDSEQAVRAEEARKVEEARRAAQAVREQRGDQTVAEAATPAETAPEPIRITGRVDGVAAGTGRASEVDETPRVARLDPEAGTPSTPPSEPARAATRSAAPPPTLNGLRKGLPYPVRGEIQGRFGMDRPEGGTWRGIVLRAKEGTRVSAVAPGRVVYAGWLGGFGNLMIVDHGSKFLSVYAYNESLLKQVGDTVNAGDSIATVGATGGQVEPGLYFEIRHEGKPVNPLLWLGG